MKLRPSSIPLLAALLLASCAACRPDEGERLVVVANAAPAAIALLGRGAGSLPVVLAQANGVALPFILDTGTGLTQLRTSFAASLGLRVDPERSTHITGMGGTSRMPNALLRDLQIGRRVFRNLSVPVAPGGEQVERIAGIIGADLLRRGALEIDLPASRVALHDSPSCLAAPPPWPGAEEIPVELRLEGLPIITIHLNDRPVRALVDTGAVRTVLRRDRIADFGIPASALTAPPAGTIFGTGTGNAAFHLHQGARLRLGERTQATLPIVLAPLPPTLPVDVLLGQDMLGPRRLWLSYAGQRLYLAPSSARP
ncbi:aspartyl protease family protein [Roseomonas sp. SSH11]|uniref:Aspartyl protease family protein n=1 Tax=Pararoseomonas baculiformis TaxID=2820812 RepID=A0ABS4AIH6_9PROT|nr:retropepsin-like aspartic protease [Pararoseomonas baculiformis]MBP0446832.1 aspartyl protease family protein [Pararoseomonas baculiformis]